MNKAGNGPTGIKKRAYLVTNVGGVIERLVLHAWIISKAATRACIDASFTKTNCMDLSSTQRKTRYDVSAPMGSPPGARSSRGSFFSDDVAIALRTTWNSGMSRIILTARACAAALVLNLKPPLFSEPQGVPVNGEARFVRVLKPRRLSPWQNFRRSGFCSRNFRGKVKAVPEGTAPSSLGTCETRTRGLQETEVTEYDVKRAWCKERGLPLLFVGGLGRLEVLRIGPRRQPWGGEEQGHAAGLRPIGSGAS